MAEKWRTREDSNLWPLPSEGRPSVIHRDAIGGFQPLSARNEARTGPRCSDITRTGVA
jgi:hypothetical protein